MARAVSLICLSMLLAACAGNAQAPASQKQIPDLSRVDCACADFCWVDNIHSKKPKARTLLGCDCEKMRFSNQERNQVEFACKATKNKSAANNIQPQIDKISRETITR